MDYNRNNARMFVITDNLIFSEECTEEMKMASSPHLEMLKIISKRLKNYGYLIPTSNGNNVLQLAISIARLIKGMVVQVLPNPLVDNTISLAIYYDNDGLSNSVVENFKKVYSDMLTGNSSDKMFKPYKPMMINGAVFFGKAELGAYNNIEKEDGAKYLAIEKIVSELPINYAKGRK